VRALLFGVAAVLVWILFFDALKLLFTRDHLARFQQLVESSGPWGALTCLVLYVVFTLLFLPCTPISLVVGAVYGPVRGTVLASAGLTLAVGAAFLIARYGARRRFERWAADWPGYPRIEEGIARQGWRLVLITRLSPVNPYHFLNYAYGLTRIPFWHYMLASWAGMLLPVFSGVWAGSIAGAALTGRFQWLGFFLLLGAAAIAALLVYLLPRLLQRRVSPSFRASNDGE
jgi:uncharacterized membrane protein YdjX (TVP38/TMEM64 family)